MLISKINTLSYNEYRDKVLQLAAHGQTSGEQTEEHIQATLINAQRMKRIDHQCELLPQLAEMASLVSEKHTWFVITEAWCGDSAQNTPVLAKIANASPNLEIRLLFRDEHPEIMNEFLSNGKRAIPKLICVHDASQKVIGTWGPRPALIQDRVTEYKLLNPTGTKDEFNKNLHLWYARDKTQSLQEEFLSLFSEWGLLKETNVNR
ncbi:MAG: thioredoxin family protein [Bacteroidia bacterium]|nr:thioredoxin family protein [Bacteroidia bacterium]